MNAAKAVARRLWHWLIDRDVRPGDGVPEAAAWRKRYDVVGSFQARYLFLILVLGVFFIALDGTLTDSPGCLQPATLATTSAENCNIAVPIIDLKLSLVYVWTWGAPVLLLLLLAILGSLRAALKAKVLSGLRQIEPFDEHPNLIDMAVYSYPDLKGPWSILGVLSYLLYLSVFWVEAVYLAWRLLRSDPRPPFSGASLSAAVLLAVLGTPRLVKMWVKRLHEFLGTKAPE